MAGQVDRLSYLEVIDDLPSFVPFRGPDADRVLRKLRSKILPSAPVTEDDLRRAVESLTHIRVFEMSGMNALHGGVCNRCGDCCRTICKSIAFSKEELKVISKYLKTPYKKLKRKIRAMPVATHMFEVPGRPCPFLRGRNFCTIYEVRPRICELYPMGTAVLRATATSRLDMTPKCPVVCEVLAILALSRLQLEVVYREHPEHFEEFKQFQEGLWRHLKDMPYSDRLRAVIATASGTARPLDKHMESSHADSLKEGCR